MSFQGSGLFDASGGGDFAGMAAFAGQEGQGCSGDFAAMAAFAGQEGQGCGGDFAGMAGFAGQEGQGCGGCGWDQMGAWPSQQLGSTDGLVVQPSFLECVYCRERFVFVSGVAVSGCDCLQAFANVPCGGRNVTCTLFPSGYESLFSGGMSGVFREHVVTLHS